MKEAASAKDCSPVHANELANACKHLKSPTSLHQSDSLEYDKSVASTLEAIYEKHDGDLKAIFEELDENPRKALKHPPSSAKEFGKKYAQGFYTYAEEK